MFRKTTIATQSSLDLAGSHWLWRLQVLEQNALSLFCSGAMLLGCRKTLTFVPVDLGCAQQCWKWFLLQWTSVNGQTHSELECCDRHRVLSFPWKPRLREQPEEQPEDGAECCEMLDVTTVTLMGSQQLCLPAGDLTGRCFPPN